MMSAKLKNGSELQSSLVAVTMMSLEKLIEKPIVFYELVMLCRDRSHDVWSPEILQDLKALALVQPDGLPHRAIQDVVLSAVTGDGMDMELGSPLA